MFSPDEPQHMLGLSEHLYKHTQWITLTESVYVCVCLHYRQGGMFLAETQSEIRPLSMPETRLTPFCLFLAAANWLNHIAALLVVASKLLQATAWCLCSLHLRDATLCEGQRLHGGTAPGGRRGTEILVTDWRSLSKIWKAVRQLSFF